MTAVVREGSSTPVRAARGRDPQWLVRQMPGQMLASDFFVRYLQIFQDLGSTLLEDADNIEHLSDLTVTPTPFIGWLGSWIGVDSLDDSMPELLRRRIVATAAATLAKRGTVSGLRSFLELLSGGPAEVRDGGGVWAADAAPEDTAWVTMWVGGTGSLATAAFVDLVKDEVPAHVRAELHVGDDLVWSSEEDEEW